MFFHSSLSYGFFCLPVIGSSFIWNLAIPDIGFLPDIGSPTDTISGHVSRCRGFLLTQYRDISDVTRYRVPISSHPISGHHVTIVNYIPDIGINIGYNIGCPNMGDIISQYQCQYRVPISGVPILGYDSHSYCSQYRTRYWVLFLVFHADDEVPANPRGELQGAKKYGQQKKQGIKVMSFSS
jgi:hypothetical protein